MSYVFLTYLHTTYVSFHIHLPGSLCSSPQGNRTDSVQIDGIFVNKEQCAAHAEACAPPLWDSSATARTCFVCDEAFNSYLVALNCHNCGRVVCADCSDELWLRSMLPDTFYNPKEDRPRTCTPCNDLSDQLFYSLKAGDLEEVQRLHASGNVNLHQPFALHQDAPYAVHCAAASGNVALMRWLLETQHCLLRDPTTQKALMTVTAQTALTVAARKGDCDMMRHLLHSGCSVSEVTDVNILQRALHAAMLAPGALPSLNRRTQSRALSARIYNSDTQSEQSDLSN
jgi:hypothetical protein